MDFAPLAAGLELWVSPLEVRAELLCLEAPGSRAVVRPWRRSCHSRERTRPSRSRTVRPSPLLFLASKVFCSFIVCTPTCAKHSPLRSTVHLPPAWFLPQYEHHSRPGHRAGLVREVPPRIAAGQRRSEHCRWLGGNRTKRRVSAPRGRSRRANRRPRAEVSPALVRRCRRRSCSSLN